MISFTIWMRTRPVLYREGRAGAVQHLVAEDAQGHEPVRSAAGFEVAEQVDDRVGHPVLVGRRQFQDAMRMKIGVKDLVLKGPARGRDRSFR